VVTESLSTASLHYQTQWTNGFIEALFGLSQAERTTGDGAPLVHDSAPCSYGAREIWTSR
jgi:hypothetical protein